jgi:regulator of RNase E activity RraA
VPPFESDQEIFSFVRDNLYVAVISDILDSLGHRHQVMSERLRPLLPDIHNCGFAGRARTIRWVEIDHTDYEDPYGKEIDAVDALRPGDVVVNSTDFANTNAPWCELLSTAAVQRGAAGCICDSQVRDCVKIIEMGFPVYYRGIRALDSQGRGRVIDFDVPVRCGEVLVNSGDLVFADFDGIVVIPQSVEAQVLELASEKVGKENQSRDLLLQGALLRDVYNQLGVL